MIKVSISRNSILTNQATFNTQEEADTWFSTESTNGSFGKSDRWVLDYMEDVSAATDTRTVEDFPAQDAVLDENGEEIYPAQEAKTHTEYFLLAEYTMSQEDITAQLQSQAAIQKGIQAQEFGAQVIAAVYALNQSSEVTTEELEAMMADSTLATAERLLWNGSLMTARAMIAAMPTSFFTSEQIAQIVALIDSYIAQLA